MSEEHDVSRRRHPPPSEHGEVLTEISDGIVGLLKEHYGKGPTHAKTYYQEDLVVCLMRGGFTAAERALIEAGRTDAVIGQRMELQQVLRQRFAQVIEHATGRSVIGFMSANQADPPMTSELFVLAPQEGS